MDTISSISYDQVSIIKNIIKLHIPKGCIDLDPTYSKGVFYKGEIKPPYLKFDKYPQTSDTIRSCATTLPLNSASVGSIMFDPPFVISCGPSLTARVKGSNIISNRFSSFKDPESMYRFYFKSIVEFDRILKPKGVLVFKCQDTVSSGKNYFSHVIIMHMAHAVGFYPKDLWVLLAKSRVISGKIKRQRHARKFHSYFWVFEKRESRVKYDNYEGITRCGLW